jgi:hypothetical protein
MNEREEFRQFPVIQSISQIFQVHHDLTPVTDYTQEVFFALRRLRAGLRRKEGIFS